MTEQPTLDALTQQCDREYLERLLAHRTRALTRVIAERDEARAALGRVESHHAAHGGSVDGGKTWSHSCLAGCGKWPCLTVLAIDPHAEEKLNARLRSAYANEETN